MRGLAGLGAECKPDLLGQRRRRADQRRGRVIDLRPTGLRLSSSRSLAKGSTIMQVPSGAIAERTWRSAPRRVAHVVQAVEEGDKVVVFRPGPPWPGRSRR